MTRTLYLLRHAKSSWSDPSLPDEERPLAPRGKRDAKRIARHLRRAQIKPALVLCSSAARSQQTLKLIRPSLAEAPVQIEEDLYAADSDALLERLHAVPAQVDSVLLIGHNPSLHDLSLALAGTGPERERLEAKLPTAGLATLALGDTPWGSLQENDGKLVAYVVPKQLR